MQNKRILIIHHVASLGGGSKSLIDVASMLSKKYDISICVPGRIDDLRQIIPDGIDVIQLRNPVPTWISHAGGAPFFSSATIKKLLKLRKIRDFSNEIESYNPDLIIFNTIVSVISAPFINKNIKKICIDRETQISKFAACFYSNIVDKNIDAIGFLAEAEKRKFRFHNCRTFLVPDCVPKEDIKPITKKQARIIENIAQDRYVVLYMGGSQRIKGPDVALESMRIITKGKNENKYLLIVAGAFDYNRFTFKSILRHIYNISETKYRLSIRRNIELLTKNGSVRFDGNRSDIISLLCASDIVIFPSTKPHQPRPCIEAGYYSRPVIISNYKETEEYFRNNYNALTIRPNSSIALAKMIKYASLHSEEMKKLADNNKYMSNKMHDYNHICDVLAEIVAEVLS